MSDLLTSDEPFSDAEKAALAELLGAMIPAEGERPSAADETILQDVLTTARPFAHVIRQALAQYADLGLERFSQSRSAQVNSLVSLVVQCYYRDDRVMQAIGMEARPPHPAGYELEAGDWSLLEPVKTRGEIFRKV